VGGWLASRAYAAYGKRRGSRLLDLAWKMPPYVRRLGKRLWPGAARDAFAATLAGQLGPFDWPDTRAFVGFHGDLWVNLEGREPAGRVGEAEAASLLEEIAEGLLGIRDPETGEAVFAAAHRREELYSGPALGLAPDLMLDSWSAGYRVAPGREASGETVIRPAPLAGVEEAWSADHRPLGIFVASGPRIAPGAAEELSLYDVCPTALALLEAPIPRGLDGRAVTEALDAAFLAVHPVRIGATASERETGGEYSDEEAAAVASHLKDLGYIE
jgi:hypothetical protein